MLEEEKIIISEELNDILAYKENIYFFKKLCIENIINNEYNELNENADLLFEELLSIDAEKAADYICEELYDLLILNKQNNDIINDKYLYRNINNSFII